MDPSVSHNGVEHQHQEKHHKHKKKYVLGPDGRPKIGPDGHRIRIKTEHGSRGDYIIRIGVNEAELKDDKDAVNVVANENNVVDKVDSICKVDFCSAGTNHKHVKQEYKQVKQEYSDDEPLRKIKKSSKKVEKRKADDKKHGKHENGSPVKAKRPKKEAEADQRWKWWEETGADDDKKSGVKWKFLQHKGPVFPPDYEPLPEKIHFKYDGKTLKLQSDAEEVMTFYAKMLDHDYVTKPEFNKNFFMDWRKSMTSEERGIITDLGKCNFRAVNTYFKEKSEERKARSKEEKQREKLENEKLIEEYGFCDWDGHKEKIGNFRLEPPGLFRGRGNHPKMGRLKKRLRPEDIIINCSRDSEIPKPPAGHRWKVVRHDNAVTWLVSWTENVQGGVKYIMLNPNSRIKGEKDWQKYEMARKLKSLVDNIREGYMRDLKKPQMMIRQRAVALYFIDKLALRAGNEKEDGESADTVGCCSLRCEHIKLHKHIGEQDYVVEFDFLGKDSIRYYNKVPVLKQVFKNLVLFTENKEGGDDLFDRLNTSILNKYLNSLMDGLTAKVFRTYNASITLQNQLIELTEPDDDKVASKMLSYNRANRAVAVLCNHQRAAPKNFNEQMTRMNDKIQKKQLDIADCKREVKSAKSDYKHHKSESKKKLHEAKKKKLDRLQEQLMKLEVQATDKEENKEIALGTSKLNYLDPRITVAWCKKYSVPVEKIYNKTQRDKFAWAIAMVDETYEF